MLLFREKECLQVMKMSGVLHKQVQEPHLRNLLVHDLHSGKEESKALLLGGFGGFVVRPPGGKA